GSPIQSSAWPAATATDSARGSAFPTSSDALMMSRRAMNFGSSPAAIIAASQYSAASGSLPRRLLMNAEPVESWVGSFAAEALDEGGDSVVVAVAGAVVGEDTLLGGRLDVLEPRADMSVRVADVLGFGDRRGTFEDIERRARVAARERHEVLECVIGQGHDTGRAERAGEPS